MGDSWVVSAGALSPEGGGRPSGEETTEGRGKVGAEVSAVALLCAVSIALLVVSAPETYGAGRATIRVHPDRVLGPVNRLILGHNMLAYQDSREDYGNRGAGIWDPEKRQPVPDYVALARECGMTVARWPGGCGAHRYNWKKTVGPLADRPDQQFGLPEFLAFCEAVGCQPILTIAVYWGTAQDGADLVEYLNSPNDSSNPNGGGDWAAIRAADGHPEPYGVVWFEYGNESYHGDHGKPPTQVTAEQYARQYLEYRTAMRAVDPRIRLGALIQHHLEDWNRSVLKIAGREMDFGIEHTYVPNYYSNEDAVPGEELMKAAVACDAQIQRIYDSLNALVEEETGRTDLPWAITEYNGHFVQEKPVPYRQSLGNALRNAEHIRVMMRPANRIALADFWQFSNEYWGSALGYVHQGETPVKQANYYVFELYARHFRDTLIEAEVECPTFDFDGAANVRARAGEPSEFRLHEENLLPEDATWGLRGGTPVEQTLEGDTVVAEFAGEDVNYYHPQIVLSAEANTGYRVTGLVQAEGLTGTRGAGFQVGDARGWTATQSCTVKGDVLGDADWAEVSVDYVTLPDTEEIEILCRRLEGGGPVSGTARYRLLRVQRFVPENAGAAPYVTANAARRDDGTITLMIVNKDLDEPTEAAIELPGGVGTSAQAWSLTGPSATSTNREPEPKIGMVEVPVAEQDGRLVLELPACSVTAVEIPGLRGAQDTGR